MVPLGAVEATGVAGRGAEAERALGDGRAAALAGGTAGLGVLHGDGRLGGGRRRRGRHCGAGDANGSGEEAEAGVSGEEGGEEHAMWGWTGGEVGWGEWDAGPVHTYMGPRCKMTGRALVHTKTMKTLVYFKLKNLRKVAVHLHLDFLNLVSLLTFSCPL